MARTNLAAQNLSPSDKLSSDLVSIHIEMSIPDHPLDQFNTPEGNFPPNDQVIMASMNTVTDNTDNDLLGPRPAQSHPADRPMDPRVAPNLPTLYFMLYYVQLSHQVSCTQCPDGQDPMEYIYECIQSVRRKSTSEDMQTSSAPTAEDLYNSLKALIQKINLPDIVLGTTSTTRPIKELLREAGSICNLVPYEIIRQPELRLALAIATILVHNGARLPFTRDFGHVTLSQLMDRIHINRWKVPFHIPAQSNIPSMVPTRQNTMVRPLAHGSPPPTQGLGAVLKKSDIKMTETKLTLLSKRSRRIEASLLRIDRFVSGIEEKGQLKVKMEEKLLTTLENIRKNDWAEVLSSFDNAASLIEKLRKMINPQDHDSGSDSDSEY